MHIIRIFSIIAALSLIAGCATTGHQSVSVKSEGIPEMPFYTPTKKSATAPAAQPVRTGGQAPDMAEYDNWKKQSSGQKNPTETEGKRLGVHQMQPQPAPYNPGKQLGNPSPKQNPGSTTPTKKDTKAANSSLGDDKYVTWDAFRQYQREVDMTFAEHAAAIYANMEEFGAKIGLPPGKYKWYSPIGNNFADRSARLSPQQLAYLNQIIELVRSQGLTVSAVIAFSSVDKYAKNDETSQHRAENAATPLKAAGIDVPIIKGMGETRINGVDKANQNFIIIIKIG
jgi:hypothetical protein